MIRLNTLIICALVTAFAMSILSCDQKKSSSSGPLFELVDPQKSGVLFENKLFEYAEEHIFNFNYLYNGAGVGLGDINNDGLLDIYFTANRAKDKLYLNKGNFKFEDISESSGISAFSGWRSGVAMADVNGDGLLDIYVCRGGFKNEPTNNANLLFINKGNNKFSEEGSRYGIADIGFSIAASFFDYDKDNDLDLIVTNRPEKFYLNIDQVMEGKKNGSLLSRNNLYRNNGDNTFSMVTEEAGLTGGFGYGLSVTTGDLDQDGDEDIYISNDFVENDYYYQNQGNGTFKEAIKDIVRHTAYYAMGTDFGDVNNDGWEDIFNVEMRPEDYKRSKTSMPVMNAKLFDTMALNNIHMQYMHNCLQLNNGNGSFSEIAQLAGIDRTDWSWATLLCDLDNDQYKDIYVANGIKRDLYNRDAYGSLMFDLQHNNMKKTTEEIMRNLPSVKSINYTFRNNHDLTFSKVMNDWGLNQPSHSNGAAVGDLDNDGNLDLVVNNIDDPAFIYKNNGSGKNYLRVSCVGPEKNISGYGAKVKIKYGDQIQYSEVRTSRGYLSSSEAVVHFGMGDASIIDELVITWPDGKVNKMEKVKVNKTIEIKYSDATGASTQESIAVKPLFADKTALISPPFVHRENEFDDYKVQILLPHRMSRLGPFISVADVNKDGLEDFFVGGAKGQAGALYLQTTSGEFKLISTSAFEADKNYEDMSSCFFDADQDGDNDLYVVSGGSENPEGSNYQDRLYLNDGNGKFNRSVNALPKITSSGSCVVAEDFDGDGDVDIFRGGRQIPQKYPFAPRSYLLENKSGGKFSDVTETKAPDLMSPGMVTTAVFADLDKDNKKELLVAGEWMPIQIYKIDAGQYKLQASEVYGLSNTEGWWNRIVPADVDGDGDLDFVCGNLGENYKFHANAEKPFQVFCNDFDQNGSYDIVLAKYNGTDMVPVRGKQCSQEQMPFINQKYPSFNAFADAKLKDIYGEGLEKGLHLNARYFKTIIWMNNNGKFEKKELPHQAQFSTVQSAIVLDLNQDQKPDIMVAGNFFNTEVETTRADAGIGYLFFQNPDGTWKNLTCRESGVFLPYDVKDIKAIKSGNKTGVLVASNNGKLIYLEKSE
ncbi:MAG: VCBS repeat-containing protein [Saprospiraceae bacterium]|nr:VCBS repeat-containing protein [Candidatus Vicinibacter affinis]